MLKFAIDDSGRNISVPAEFIKKYMCNAPQGYSHVYLYGLCAAQLVEQCDEFTLQEELHMSLAEIQSALRYWESKHLVAAKTSGKTTVYEFLATEDKLEQKPVKKTRNMYEYEYYNNLLGTLLKRTLTPSDLNTIYDFTDIYTLPQDVVIALIEYCVDQRGARVSIAYLNTVAQSWAEDGINTTESAQQKIEEYRAVLGGAAKLMRIMGFFNNKYPGKTEMDLYNKWTQIWGFTHETIEYIMKDKEFTKDQPFKYLDAILRNLYEQGIITSRKVSEYNAAYKKRVGGIKEILTVLEYSKVNNISPKYEKFYAKWQEKGIEFDIILLACAQCVKTGSRRFETVDELLEEWTQKGISGKEEIEEYLKTQNTLDAKVKQVYDCAGVKRSVSDSDRASYLKYTKDLNMSHEVLMYAAEISSIAQTPLKYMHKVLNTWGEKGINTLEKAKSENMSNIFADIKKSRKEFPQREHDEEETLKREMEAYKRMDDNNDL